jgi:hypothetical protein
MRIVNYLLFNFVAIFLISTVSYADIPFCSFSERWEKEQMPLFRSQDLNEILIWLNFDIDNDPEAIVETDNYIHKINMSSHCTLISHKGNDHIFVGVRDIAYFLLLNDKTWNVYIVFVGKREMAITKLWRAMMLDFYKWGDKKLEEKEYVEVY